MRVPKRQSQILKRQRDDETSPIHLTPKGIQRLKDDLHDLEKNQRPQAVEDVSRSVALGDLSENADYQEAKGRLSRIDGRIFGIRERLKRAVVIENEADGRVHLGSTVTLFANGHQTTYQIVGPHESNPSRGRISHVSPLGAALLDHAAGESVKIRTENGEVAYDIIEVQ